MIATPGRRVVVFLALCLIAAASVIAVPARPASAATAAAIDGNAPGRQLARGG